MNIPFLDRWRRNRPTDGSRGLAAAFAHDPDGVGELFSECELLRSQAAAAGVDLDDSATSLAELDQLLPRWRDDPETLPWLGNDAGLYLGSVIVRTVQGAAWHVGPGGQPVVRLASGREIHVVEAGLDWAVNGHPELYRVYAEASEA
ncbi:DUF6278 family protein [Streptomyces odontomachi]|uniref:DUF6278 family protein n=1 Tax=Streptomyces odontomachi TaxID=2944940 RepID=UPI00210D705D|nr:DUF6278 family protein [Streptomyces sp. ODS25]